MEPGSATLAGRYTLLRKIAAGGMAEVFLARRSGPLGFEKLVVVKRILPSLAGDARAEAMFLEEARLAADLRHPNVVDVYEVDRDEQGWFLAMEFLEGPSVGEIIRAAKELGEPVPWGHAIRIAVDAASGLHHAHTKADLRGRALHVVHRDVSPQNLIVTFSGTTKVIDFGIAAEDGRGVTDQPGTVRGKLSYMSPEQISSRPLDARSDQFSLAIVLWELTTLTRLFERDLPAQTAQAVRSADVRPPSAVVAEYPRALERIVLKALSLDPAHRFHDCAELAAALEALGEEEAAHGLAPASSARLSQYLRGLFRDSRERDAAAIAVELSSDAPTAAVTAPEAALEGPSSRSSARARGAGEEREVPPPARVETPIEEEAFLAAVSRFLAVAPRERPGNVPPRTTSFVGRVADLSRLRERVAHERLVAIIGSAGVGKSRLAIELAAGAGAEEMPGGAWVCDVSGAASLEEIWHALAGALDVPLDDTAEPGARIAAALALRGPLLLVVDGLDPCAGDAGVAFSALLAAAPETRVVVTSREPVARAELVRLAPLATEEALQLLDERVRGVNPRRATRAGDHRAALEIVRVLDGLPLAIELAAPLVGAEGLANVAASLPARLDELAGNPFDARKPEATLFGAIGASWERLDEAERSVLLGAAELPGGFSSETARAVIPSKEPLTSVLRRLREKAFLRLYLPPEFPTELRLGVDSSVRSFLTGKLGAVAQVEIRSRRAAWFVGEAEKHAALARGESSGATPGNARGWLALEASNLRAVFSDVCADPARAALAARIALSLEPLLAVRGPARAMVELADTALAALASGGDPSLRARLLAARGAARRAQGDLAAAIVDLNGAISLRDEPATRLELALARFVRGDVQAAIEGYRDVLGHAVAPTLEARARCYLGIARFVAGDADAARSEYAAALPLARACGDRVTEGRLLGNAAILSLERGELDDARAGLEDAISVLREAGDRRLAAYYRGKLGGLEWLAGRPELAVTRLERAIRTLRELGDRRHEALFLATMGGALAQSGHFEPAAAALDRATDLIARVGDTLLAEAVSLHREQLTLARARAEKALGSGSGTEAVAARLASTATTGRSDEIRLAKRLLERALAT